VEDLRPDPAGGVGSPTSARPLPTGTVTFLFTDIEGSTRLLQRLGDGHREIQDRLAATAMQEEFAASPPALTLDDPRVSARSAIGAEAASRAMDEGRSMDPDAAVRYAGEAEGQG
jgi:hypothetical protein